MNKKTYFAVCLSALLIACADKTPHKQTQPDLKTDTVVTGSARTLNEQEYSSDEIMRAGPASFQKNISLAHALHPSIPAAVTDREHYLAFEQNGVKRSVEQPVSTFSIDVDTAAYSNIRRMLQQEGRLPPAHAVRIEEMINYFDYDYPQPDKSQPFSVSTELAQSPVACTAPAVTDRHQGF